MSDWKTELRRTLIKHLGSPPGAKKRDKPDKETEEYEEYDLTEVDPEHKGEQYREDGKEISEPVRTTKNPDRKKEMLGAMQMPSADKNQDNNKKRKKNK